MEKGLKTYLIYISLIVSVSFNAVLLFSVFTLEAGIKDKIKAEYEEELNQKNLKISYLEKQINGDEHDPIQIESMGEEDVDQTNTEVSITDEGSMIQYEKAAKQFMEIYLSYDSLSFSKRREKLAELVSDEELLDVLAPQEWEEASDSMVFESSIQDEAYYISVHQESPGKIGVVADITSVLKENDSNAVINGMYYLEIESQDKGEITVNEFRFLRGY